MAERGVAPAAPSVTPITPPPYGSTHQRQDRSCLPHRSRPRRWHDAVAELLALQAVYAAWLEALPDTLQGTATADALQVIVDLDLDTLAAIEPPRGYGRD